MYSAKSSIIPSWRDWILGVAKLAKVILSHIENNAEAAFADIFPYHKTLAAFLFHLQNFQIVLQETKQHPRRHNREVGLMAHFHSWEIRTLILNEERWLGAGLRITRRPAAPSLRLLLVRPRLLDVSLLDANQKPQYVIRESCT
jgi:hypothetical protein